MPRVRPPHLGARALAPVETQLAYPSAMPEAAFDLVIVGGGVAGLCAALAAPEGARIAVIDKGEAGAGSSPLAQGGLAAAMGPEDTPDLHASDTIAAGAGLCDAKV